MIQELSKLCFLSVGLIVESHAQASAVIGFRVEGGGTQQVYQLNNGNYLGLWGFDNRGNASPVTITSANDITQGFITGSASIVNYYNGINPVNVGASEFDPLVFPLTIDEDALGKNPRLFDSVWAEWTGGFLVYQQPSGGTTTMSSSNVTRPGDPIVPMPGTTAMAVIGLGALAMRRRRA